MIAKYDQSVQLIVETSAAKLKKQPDSEVIANVQAAENAVAAIQGRDSLVDTSISRDDVELGDRTAEKYKAHQAPSPLTSGQAFEVKSTNLGSAQDMIPETAVTPQVDLTGTNFLALQSDQNIDPWNFRS